MRKLALFMALSILSDGHPSMGDTEYVDTDEIKKELGDVLWYVSQMAETFGLGLEDIAQANVDKLRSRMERDKIKGDGDNR